jgi:hypothetical protein
MQTINEGNGICEPERRGNYDHNLVSFPECIPERATSYKAYKSLASFTYTRRNTKSDADNIAKGKNV